MKFLLPLTAIVAAALFQPPSAGALIDHQKAEETKLEKMIAVYAGVTNTGKAHITRKRMLRKYDTNQDWYIDESEIGPIVAYLKEAGRYEEAVAHAEETRVPGVHN